mmetsp:Transcript_10034/g.13769  ORF Transcript_10034/g.13769 Transcript_10034/m.13769 type:complete len:130 (-) Transcript_10034:368-757(-)
MLLTTSLDRKALQQCILQGEGASWIFRDRRNAFENTIQFNLSTLISVSYFVIPPNSLRDGSVLTFTLSSSTSNSSSVFSSVSIKVNIPLFGITPNNGVELSKLFEFNSKDWTDRDQLTAPDSRGLTPPS